MLVSDSLIDTGRDKDQCFRNAVYSCLQLARALFAKCLSRRDGGWRQHKFDGHEQWNTMARPSFWAKIATEAKMIACVNIPLVTLTFSAPHILHHSPSHICHQDRQDQAHQDKGHHSNTRFKVMVVFLEDSRHGVVYGYWEQMRAGSSLGP